MFQFAEISWYENENAECGPRCSCYLVCLSCIYSCGGHAGAISARVSMLQTLHEASALLKVKMSESASVVAGFQERTWELTEWLEKFPPRAEWQQSRKFTTQGARPRCRLVPGACENVLLQTFNWCYPLWPPTGQLLWWTIATRDIGAAVRVSLDL